MGDTEGGRGVLGRFSPATRAWFEESFPQGPTPVQAEAWQAIAGGGDVLVVAPTGSGKTLAAFLWAIDRLMGGGEDPARAGTPSSGPRSEDPAPAPGPAPSGTGGPRILYISPMKALGVDVSRNLRHPLAGISARREASGAPHADVRVGVRSGDTPSSERGRLLRHPPDILITTPESLYLMETSRAREILREVDTVIVDEVHAVAGSKRGAHLAIGLERLDLLTGRPAQRIGLSATVRPREEVARFLGGARPVGIVAPPAAADLEVRIVVPVADMTDLAVRGGRGGPRTPAGPSGGGEAGGPGSIWPHVEAAILDQVMAHRSTIVFVNSRGLAEKLTARLNELHAERVVHPELTGPRPLDADSPAREPRTGGTFAHLALPPGAPSPDGAVPDIARAHHGSVSKERRELIEHDLKSGDLRCVVATSSLELGIDMGAVDLVIQVAAPPSVASGLQRAGRAGHQVGGTSQALVYPRTRRELIDAAVTVERMEDGLIEELRVPRNPLDVLAQQTVAAAVAASDPAVAGVATASGGGPPEGPGLDVDDWFAAVRRAAPFRDLPRGVFDGVLDMLAGRYPSEAFSELRPRLVWDRVTGTLRSRPGTRRLAVTSGGTIPDRGAYRVVLPEEEGARGAKRVGELDEEMVFESRVGDVITLGAATWRIQEITTDRVVVVPAPGRPSRLPFWHGDGPGRPAELGAAMGAFIREAGEPGAPEDGAAGLRLARTGLDGSARRNLQALLEEQRGATGVLPTDRTLVLERCRDEAGDWRLVLHSCFGRRVNAAWALAVGHRLRQQLGIDPQVMAADDGIVMLVPDTTGRLPGAEAFRFDACEIQRIVRDGVGQSALFAGRFRECAARALLLPRRNPGQRTPLWQQRQRAAQLLAVASAHPDFPILLETARECLQDVYDLPALSALMGSLEAGEVRIVEAETPVPSPFAQTLLFGYVADHVYDTDTPVAERRASLLALDTALLAELLGESDLAEILDPDVVARVGREIQRLTPERRVRGPEGVADLLRVLGPLSADEVGRRLRSPGDRDGDADEDPGPAGAAEAERCLEALSSQRRAVRVMVGGEQRWAAVEELAALRDALGTPIPETVPVAFRGPGPGDPLGDLVRGYARTHGPFTAADVAARLGIGTAVASDLLERLRVGGEVVGVRIAHAAPGGAPDGDAAGGPGSDPTPGPGAARGWVSAGILRVLRLRSLAAARAATRPVDGAAYTRFLLDWQGVGAFSAAPGPMGEGLAVDPVEATEQAIDQLAGLALPASVWESAVLPARVPGYRPAILDQLVSSGAVVWCGAGRLGDGDGLVVLCPSDLAEELLPDPLPTPSASDPAGLPARVLDVLSDGGAYFPDQIARLLSEGADRPSAAAPSPDEPAAPPSSTEVGDGLRELMWSGYVTADTYAPVRAALTGGRTARAPRPARRRGRARVRLRAPIAHGGRWALVPRGGATPTARALAAAEGMVERYGVVARAHAVVEDLPGGFSAVIPVMRVLEDSGRVLRGRFVDGLGGAQFARRDAIDRLRSFAGRDAGRGAAGAVALSAVDPANPFGSALAWPDAAGAPEGGDGGGAATPARRAGAFVVIREGRAVAWIGRGGRAVLTFTADPVALDEAAEALAGALRAAGAAPLTVETADGAPVRSTRAARSLRAAGFVETPKGLRLYP
ncbi:MAG: ATP-dependent helicase [Actinomyces sp.]|jgi:ATP-dependent Lhr-like helicase|nr:ATP-dependent helicase [Actinomyces sp.]MCI1787923.1 ATP-dependent helicase [Actinomyces sp.]MCI1830967.1 ATP-dependent helicase [Actinomyces sp.]MCI1866316.1 ATP-dependent helicase [Actinomyces sp.]